MLLRRVRYWLAKPCHISLRVSHFRDYFSDYSSSKVVSECLVSFGFLPAKSQILIRTARFLQKFTVSENSLCMMSANDARRQLHTYSYLLFLYNLVTIFKPHASGALLFCSIL